MIKLLPGERKLMADYIYSACAVALDDSKAYLIESRLSDIAESLGCRTFTDLLAKARSDFAGTVKRRIIGGITTGETLFFRDNSPFELLRNKILPELIDRRKRTGARSPIRIWSAACSTGQEIYSAAIVLKELLGDPIRYGVRLVGTDISDEAVARASKGTFSAIEMSRGLSDAFRSKYFSASGGGWQLNDELRAMAVFKRLNLMEDFSSLGKFDIVFCRNVAIYFTEPDRASLFGRIQRSLESNGSLIIGSMESLNGICNQYEAKRYLRSVYYQSKVAA